MQIDKFPEIRTPRLILGKLSFLDIPKIVEYAGNIEVAKTTLNIPHPYREEDAIFWINNANQGFKNKTQYTFGIRLMSSNEFIGSVGIKVNNRFSRGVMGYWLAKSFWNKGYATEAVAAMLEFGFTVLSLNKIYATHLIENEASGKVMLKNGMIKEGELKEHTKKGAHFRTEIQYRLTKNEFESLN